MELYAGKGEDKEGEDSIGRSYEGEESKVHS